MGEENDLIALVADRDMEQALHGLLTEPKRLGTRPVKHQIRIHPGRDPGCRVRAVEFLRPFLSSCRYALVVFDLDGCGSGADRLGTQSLVQDRLMRNGWADRCKVVVIDPELESWVWAPSHNVSEALGWGPDFGSLRSWLRDRELWPADKPKPPDPKRAMRTAIRNAQPDRRPRLSATLFDRIARASHPRNCNDPALVEMRETLRSWFPVGSGEA